MGAICEWVNGADPSQCYGSRAACESGHPRRLEQSRGESEGCFAWNGAICEWVNGADPSQCYTSDAQCEQAHGGPGCFTYNGAICEWVNGADPSQCYDYFGPEHKLSCAADSYLLHAIPM